jgi:hypothetical protein
MPGAKQYRSPFKSFKALRRIDNSFEGMRARSRIYFAEEIPWQS